MAAASAAAAAAAEVERASARLRAAEDECDQLTHGDPRRPVAEAKVREARGIAAVASAKGKVVAAETALAEAKTAGNQVAINDRQKELADREKELAGREKALEDRQKEVAELESLTLRLELASLGISARNEKAGSLTRSPRGGASGRTVDEITHKLLPFWMPTASVVAAMHQFHVPRDPEDVSVKAWKRHLDGIEKGTKSGAFSNHKVFELGAKSGRQTNEIAVTSQLSSLLEWRLRQSTVASSSVDEMSLWVHQFSTALQDRVDIALLTFNELGNAHYRVLIDVVVQNASVSKESQLDTYVWDAAVSSLPPNMPYCMLGIGLQAPYNGAMEATVWAFHGINNNIKEKQRRSLLFSGRGNSPEELMVRLEGGALSFARTTDDGRALKLLMPETHIFYNEAESSVRKVVFDPRRRDQWREVTAAAEEIYRSIGGTVVRLASGVPLYVEYPFIQGTHIPKDAREAAAAAHAVQHLHSRGFIHGDIRLSNILFDGSGGASLIDYDYAGWVHKPSLYVDNFNPEIPDGKRAEGAAAGAVMEPSHDWEALAGAFQLCLHSPNDDERRWDAALEALKRGDPGVLDGLGDLRLDLTPIGRQLFGADLRGRQGTNSPPESNSVADARKRRRDQEKAGLEQSGVVDQDTYPCDPV